MKITNLVNLTKENFDDIATKNDIVIVDFWAEWCGPCKVFKKIYEDVAEKNPTVLFGQINIDEQAELAKDFQVQSIPTVLILRQHVAVFYQPGIMPASALQDLIQQTRTLDMKKILKEVKGKDKK